MIYMEKKNEKKPL